MNLFNRGPKKQRGSIVKKGVQVKIPWGWHYYYIGDDFYLISADKEMGTLTFSLSHLIMAKTNEKFINPFTEQEETLVHIQEGRFVTSTFEGKGFIGKLWAFESNTHLIQFMYICEEHLIEKEMNKVMEILNSMHELNKVEVEQY